MWQIQIRKALVSLPVYVAVAVSFVFCLNLIALLVGGKWFSARDYTTAIALTLALWIVRQFIRFWVTVFRATRS